MHWDNSLEGGREEDWYLREIRLFVVWLGSGSFEREIAVKARMGSSSCHCEC